MPKNISISFRHMKKRNKKKKNSREFFFSLTFYESMLL